MPPESTTESTRAMLRRVRWSTLRILAHRPNGEERSRVSGPGIEFAGVREYQPGDDVRRIDWQLSARSDRAFVREAHVERGLDVWLVVDVSPSIDWGTARGLKRDVAVELSAALGQLLARQGNRIGLILFADQPLGIVPPRAGQAHLERVIGRLRHEAPRPAQGETDLTQALAMVQRLARRRSVVVLISDFLVPDGWSERLRSVAHRHEVIAVRLADPRESGLPDVGVVTFEDPENGAQLTIDTSNARLREQFAQAAHAQAYAIERTLVGCGTEPLVLRTDESLLRPLVAFLEKRRRFGRSQRARFAARPVPTGVFAV